MSLHRPNYIYPIAANTITQRPTPNAAALLMYRYRPTFAVPDSYSDIVWGICYMFKAGICLCNAANYLTGTIAWAGFVSL